MTNPEIIKILPSGLAIAKPIYGRKRFEREEMTEEQDRKLDDPRRGQAKYINRETKRRTRWDEK